MAHSYDLHLPAWGPYNKNYLGTSHVTDQKLGLRFDVNLFPGRYRRSVISVRAVTDSGAKMMAASADLSHYVYRYELEWQDRVYVDADYQSNGDEMTVTCRFCNHTDAPESLSLNVLTSLHGCSIYHNEIIDYKAALPDGCACLSASDCKDIVCRDAIASDGLRLGELRGSGFTDGTFLCGEKWNAPEHRVTYAVPQGYDAVLIRYRAKDNAVLRLNFGDVETSVTLKHGNDIQTVICALPCAYGKKMTATWADGCADLDCFIFGAAEQLANVTFVPTFDAYTPDVTPTTDGGILDFGGKYRYAVQIVDAPLFLRTLHCDDPAPLLETNVHNHCDRHLGNGERSYVDFFLRPIFMDPQSERTVKIIIRAETPSDAATNLPAEACDRTLMTPRCNPCGEKYKFSQTLMQAVVLTDVVYPIYCGQSYIRHNTPGREWDSLYTWDSGFCGIGLGTMDVRRAYDCLNAYLSPLGLKNSPYTQHGTPMPTQIFLLWELFNRTGEKALLRDFYDRALQQYAFFSDRKGADCAHGVGIFNTWDVFYNSGGWDDYPTQHYTHINHLEPTVSPVINTAITALCAKILSQLGTVLERDVSALQDDIAFFDRALNTYAWDEKSGYYGYTQLQPDGSVEILQIDGVNGDMGLDGAYPYIADICPADRSARVVDNILAGMMGQFGLCVVDKRAPYYRNDGYWNGAIWMPHQWILWKALLDHGEDEFSLRIAQTALDLWATETGRTYNCYEHFMAQNGRGAGFHQFSGLSTPVLAWFETYYKPYTVTGGFCAMVTDKKVNEDEFTFTVNVARKEASIVVTVPQEKKAVISEEFKAKEVHPGTYYLRVKEGVKRISIGLK